MSVTTEKEVVSVDMMGLVRQLMTVKGPTPATVTAITEVKMNKTVKTGDTKIPNPFVDRVQKKQVSNIFINFDYSKAVNKRLVKEGKEADFQAKQRAWGQHIPNTPLVLHNGVYYLEAGFLTNNTPKATYFVDNVETDKGVFESFLPVKSTSTGAQGLDSEVVIRDFKIDSIIEVAMGGKIYRRNDL